MFYEVPVEIERRSPSLPGVWRQPPQPLSRRVIQAVSGRSGRTLWSHPIDPTFATPSNPALSSVANVIPGRSPAALAYVDGTKWIELDAATGKSSATSFDLDFVPVRPVQFADLDGDGHAEVLALGPGQAGNQQTLAAYAAATGRSLWTATVNARYDASNLEPIAAGWPLVVDLDGDGRTDVIVPDAGPMPPAGGFRGVSLIDGATGRTRWVRPMRPENKGDDGLLQIFDAPDIDHDGVRDLVTTSFFLGRYLTTSHNGTPPVPERIYVDALSGKDGHPLWWWFYDNATDRSVRLERPRWWGAGPMAGRCWRCRSARRRSSTTSSCQRVRLSPRSSVCGGSARPIWTATV